MIVFNKSNADKATFDVEGGIIKPVPIKGGLFILRDELEGVVKGNNSSIAYEKRNVKETEWIKSEL